MEDILASIKRVIAEDPKPGQRGQRPRADIDEEDEDDILELDASYLQHPAPAVSLDKGGGAFQPAIAQTIGAQPGDASLVSQDAVDATRNSLAALAALRGPGAGVPGEGGPLEAVVRDMLRPMLKDWLDQRLPAIVEELVAKEVARITGRG